MAPIPNVTCLEIAVGTITFVWCVKNSRPARLAVWDITPPEFLLLALSTLFGAFVFPQLALGLCRLIAPANHQLQALVLQAFYELGFVAGIICGLAAIRRCPRVSSGPTRPFRKSLFAGLLTFLISLPVTAAVGKVWEFLLSWCGIPFGRQAQLDVFASLKSPSLIIAWSGIAIFGAPIVEEVVFRAGLFRYLRGRLPRWLTLTIPAAVFSAVHIDLKSAKGFAALAPLFVLGILWSLAYERTGTIVVSIIAHCLTNFTALAFFAVTK